MSQNAETPECCPKFNPAAWDDKMLTWEHKRFIKDKVRTLFFIPLNFSGVMKRLARILQDNGVTAPDALCLSDHTSRWNMDVYLAVDKEVQGAENTSLSGKFFSKVYEGPFKNTGSWCKDFASLAKGKGLEIEKWYMWYTTCPKCARKYGKNYVAIIGEVQASSRL